MCAGCAVWQQRRTGCHQAVRAVCRFSCQLQSPQAQPGGPSGGSCACAYTRNPFIYRPFGSDTRTWTNGYPSAHPGVKYHLAHHIHVHTCSAVICSVTHCCSPHQSRFQKHCSWTCVYWNVVYCTGSRSFQCVCHNIRDHTVRAHRAA